MKLTRRSALILSSAAVASSAAGVAPTFAAEGDVYSVDQLMAPKGWTDRWVGAEDAPVTIIEYASTTCPHCANFHVNTLPTLKADYVDTGKVRMSLRPFILNVLDAAVFMIAASSADEAQYYAVLDTFFANQNDWARSETPRDRLEFFATQLGFSKENFEAALTNQTLFEGMQELRQQALDDFGMTGTPSFYIDGEMLSGAKTIDQMVAEIDPRLAAAGAA